MFVKYITPKALAALIKERQATPTLVPELLVVDVRDDDYIEGNVRGSLHKPSLETGRWLAPLVASTMERAKSLLDAHADCLPVMHVVFHCTYSMNRGPTAAMAFFDAIKSVCPDRAVQVHILEGGWKGWRADFLKDPTLTNLH